MDLVSYLLSPLAVIAVFIVLCLGLWNMTRGDNPNLSQKLMRWRVGLQFMAVCLLMLAVWFAQ